MEEGQVQKVRQPRKMGRVQNKQPAPVQITAEQLLREAQAYRDQEHKSVKQRIADSAELREYRTTKRGEFEEKLRRNKFHMPLWMKYAAFEETQGDYVRARSVFERALEIDYKQPSVWLKYAEMEMKGKFINHARNVWDRAVTLLPRIDQFWYKFAYMEEMLDNIPAARQIFERWLHWEPSPNAFTSYVKLELRHGSPENARAVFERLCQCHPVVESYLKYAKFEVGQHDLSRARAVYERCLEELGDVAHSEEFFVAFAKFEEGAREYERARQIYKYALDHIPKHDAPSLYQQFVKFEKQHGSRAEIETAIIGRKRFEYEEKLKEEPRNYDVWFDFIRMEEDEGDAARIREIYERAVAQVPPVQEKPYWLRYFYLWVGYALFEELQAQNSDRARAVYKQMIKTIPHAVFSFSKAWILYAQFEIRQKNIDAARLVYGEALGRAPKARIFDSYIQMELHLGNVDRCRTLYEKYVTFDDENCEVWIAFAKLEKMLGEDERVRALYELAASKDALDMPELLWKNYIDFEVDSGEFDKARALYERLLTRTQHVKVWLSWAHFEASLEDNKEKVRSVYSRADDLFRERGESGREERAILVEDWLKYEQEQGGDVESVEARQPTRIKRKRPVLLADGTDTGEWEEYYDYKFADEQAAMPNLKLLEMAQAWKKQKIEESDSEEEEDE